MKEQYLKYSSFTSTKDSTLEEEQEDNKEEENIPSE